MTAGYSVVRRNQARELYDLLCGGMTDEEARSILELSELAYSNLKEFMWDVKGAELRERSMEHVYLEYVSSQRACISDLDESLQSIDPTKKTPAAVTTVIKAKSDIYDKIIKTGQEFGFIAKKPEEKRIIGGVVVTQMTDNQLRKAISDELGMATRLVQQHGEGEILDMEPGVLHYEEASGARALPEPRKPKMAQPVERGNTQKAKANPNHKGRRVVKQPTLG